MRVLIAGRLAEVRAAGARVDLVRLAVDADDHLVRLFLMPFERALRAVDLDPDVVLAAVAEICDAVTVPSAPLRVADDGGAVIVERPALLERLQRGRRSARESGR